jgi:hypothetical protein
MTAYSFQARFMPAIVEKTKRQTIRHRRRGLLKVGGELQLYFGMRTKFCRLIGTAKCLAVNPVWIRPFNSRVVFPSDQEVLSSTADLDRFAVEDGFADWRDMMLFWRERHPGVDLFEGDLIQWGDSFTPPAKG